jgi:hypothetical protein
MELDIHVAISMMHLFIIAPLLLYIGTHRESTPYYLFTILFYTGLFVLLYHSIRFALRFMNTYSYHYVNLIHIFIIAPVLIWIGYKQKNTLRMWYELLMMLVFSLIGYHIFKIINLLQTRQYDDFVIA